jgi:hypothetical protein
MAIASSGDPRPSGRDVVAVAPLAPIVIERRPPRLRRYVRRLAAVAAYAGAAFAVYHFVVQPVLPRDPASPAPSAQTAAADRPKSAPAVIPQWAWDVHRWLSTPVAERGARPAKAPAKLPAWFWEWRAWRIKSGS